MKCLDPLVTYFSNPENTYSKVSFMYMILSLEKTLHFINKVFNGFGKVLKLAFLNVICIVIVL